ADEEQLEFPVVFASGVNGTASLDPDPSKQEENMKCLFESIIEHIPAPVDTREEPLQFQVALLDYNDFVGRIGIGRVFRGKIHVGQQVALMKLDGTVKNFRVTKIFGFFGLKREEIQEAYAGDLIAVSDVSLRVEDTDSPDAWIVSGRGELHLSILIENMRREGYELQVSKPQVIIREIDGVKCEPIERVQIDVPEES
ncbi:translation protein, partial [Rhizophagus irregularis]